MIPADGTAALRLADRLNLIGRKSDAADLVIDHPSVSKQHCVIFPAGGVLHIRDLGSTNGTKVNGVSIVHGLLHQGDEVVIGKFKCRVALQ